MIRYGLLLLALIVLACASPAVAADKGLATDLSWNLTQETAEREGAIIADLGARWASVDLSWRQVETADGVYSAGELANVDRAIAIARGAGARIVLTVNETPQWASGTSDWRYPPTDPAKLAEFYGFLVARYGASVDAWQVWNEPNHPAFWQPDPTTDPNACDAYAGMLEAVAPVIRAGDPTARVLFAGLAFNDYPYIERCLAFAPDLPASFDVMVTHPYAMGGAAPETQVDSSPADGRLDYQTFLAYREVHRTLDKPIWFTEMGWSTCTDGHPLGCETPDVQADYLTRAYRLLEQDPYVQVALWYSLRNIGSDGPSWLDQLGLYTSTFAAKPAAAAFRAYGSAAAGPAPIAPVGQPAKATTTTTLRVRRMAPRRRSRRARIRLSGRVSGARSGRVTLLIQRRHKGGRYRTERRVKVGVSKTGAYARRVELRRSRRWRARASFAGNSGAAPSASRYRAFRTTR